MAEYLSPGVYVEEFESGLRPMEGVGTSTAGFVGMAEKGSVIGTPEFVTSFADFTRKFGGYLSESTHGEYRYLAYSVEQFFANGGTRCYVMRVVPADAKVASLKLGTVTFTAKNPGKWGNEITITATPATKGKAAVLETIDGADGVKTYTLSNASGFAVGDTVAAVVNGKAVAYTKVASVQDNKITLAAALKEDMVDKNVVPKKQFVSCECNLEIRYKDTIEVYEKISLNGESASFIGKAISRSQIVDVEAVEPAEAVAVYSIFTDKADSQKAIVRLAGGEDGGKKGITDDIFIGVDNGPGKRTGLAAFVELNNVSIMAVPGVTSPAVQLALCAQCSNLGSRFAVLDLPLEVTKGRL